MVNDAPKGDALQICDPKVVVLDGAPHLCLFATRDINKCEEPRFDYGDKNLLWRKKSKEDRHGCSRGQEEGIHGTTSKRDSEIVKQACSIEQEEGVHGTISIHVYQMDNQVCSRGQEEGIHGTTSKRDSEIVKQEMASTSRSTTTTISEHGPIGQGKKRKLQKRPWSDTEKAIVFKFFERDILMNKLPGKRDINKCMRKNPVLQKRTWKNIKDCVRNRIASKRENVLVENVMRIRQMAILSGDCEQ